jgi:hypothetical protein
VTTSYFADISTDRTIDNPHFVWRCNRKPHFSTERFDARIHQWVSDPSLACYIFWGEIGSDPISKEQAAGKI